MHPDLKKTLKSLSLDLRHLLEGQYDTAGTWRAGDLEQRLNALGVWRDRAPLPADELSHLNDTDRQARAVVDAYLALRRAADIALTDAVAEFTRETAYTWANRLLALRCMEARGLIDEVILQKGVYGGRSLEHHRLAQRQPERCMGEDDGLFAVLEQACDRQAAHLPLLFDPRAPGVALRPSVAALKQAVTLLSSAPVEIFQAPDALGWAYQYWNTEEKDRVFEKVRTERGAKIAGADIIPATQLYTEPYMVKFLVQNSLGALWMGMYPDSKLYESWEYYVRDADRAPVTKKPLREVTFLDPACGSGHFLLEAFDLFYAMYEEEGDLITSEAICTAILEHNLYGIDIDERAVQIAEASLWMKAAEKAFDFRGTPANLVATNIRLPRGKDHLAAFLAQHPEDRDLRPALEVIFEGLEHADELGSLLQLEEPVEKELRYLQAKMEERAGKPEQLALLAQVEKPKQGELPMGVESYAEWKTRTLARLKTHFAAEAQAGDLRQAFFGRSAEKGVQLFDLLARRYHIITTNPPYMGSKNFGGTLSNYISLRYSCTKYDLYSTFIERTLQLATTGGFCALVTMQSYFYIRRYESLRKLILEENTIAVCWDVGTYAFPELGDHVSAVCSVFRRSVAPANQTMIVIDTKWTKEKSTAFRQVNTRDSDHIYEVNPKVFRSIDGSPFVYWLRPLFFQFFEMQTPLEQFADIVLGMKTANNNRYHREWWETPVQSNRWVPLKKSATAKRYYEAPTRSVDWSPIAIDYYRNHYSAQLPNQDYWFQEGISYSDVATTSFCAQYTPTGVMTDFKANLIRLKDSVNLLWVIAYLNSSLGRYLLWVLNPTIGYQPNDLKRLPIAKGLASNRKDISHYAEWLVDYQKQTEETLLTSRDFTADLLSQNANHLRYTTLRAFLRSVVEDLLNAQVRRCYSEGELDLIISRCFQLTLDDLIIIWRNQGIPVACIPPREIGVFNEQLEFPTLIELWATNREILLDECSGEYYQSQRVCENILEEFAASQAINPHNAAQVLLENPDNISRLLENPVYTYLSVKILRLLGHRWPRQIKAGEPIPAWANDDGIIPLTRIGDESTLLDQVRERIAVEFINSDVMAIEREFSEVIGQPLESWLTIEFFPQHIRQFEKRPIAWQLQSGRWTARQQPAFACLVYYHKLDGDTLTTLQSQYVRPLRQRYETELRGIEGVPAVARSARQDARRIELGDLIKELSDFDAALGRVAAEGFASPALEAIVAREPVDRWCSPDGVKAPPEDRAALLRQEQRYIPDLNDGVRVNIAPLQKAGLLAADVLAKKDLDKAIADRAEWRADERRWVREGKLPRPGWWE